MNQFNKTSLDLTPLKPLFRMQTRNLSIWHYVVGVHPNTKFARRLTKEKLSTLPEFFHEAGKYMRLEDMIIER